MASEISEGGWTVIKCTIVLMVLDILVLILRLLVRSNAKAEYGADDVFAVLAVIFLMGNVAADYWSMYCCFF
jgi:hypothetical protein